MNDNIISTEGFFRFGGPSYEVLKQIESYLENEYNGDIPLDTCFYHIGSVDADEVTTFTNTEVIIASNIFQGYIFATEHVQVSGVLRYYVEDKNAIVSDAYIEPSIRQTGLFKTLHKMYRELVPDMDSYSINLAPNEKNYFYIGKKLKKDEIEDQIKLNRQIAISLGYNVDDAKNIASI